jgi:anti-sigma factor RsiW
MSTQRDIDKERELREWEAQERAVRAERLGARMGHDATVAQYRLIDRALRNPPLTPLPSDFAARVAARVDLTARAGNEHLEVWLARGLVILLVLAGAAAVSIFLGDALRDLAENLTVPEPAAFRVQIVAGWAMVIAACVGVSAAFHFGRKG